MKASISAVSENRADCSMSSDSISAICRRFSYDCMHYASVCRRELEIMRLSHCKHQTAKSPSRVPSVTTFAELRSQTVWVKQTI